MGARTRYFALRHLTQTSDDAPQRFPQVACFAFDTISSSIMIDGRFENEELEALGRTLFAQMPSRQVCLDIGANIGNHSLFFAQHFQSVIAFEPHPRTFRLLELNAELADNIKPIKLGLSDAPGHVSAAPVPGNIGMTSIGRDAANASDAVEFDVAKLDDVPEVQNLERIDFVKIDVEGHELSALKGAEQSLRQHRPIVAMEVLREDITDGTSAAVQFLKSIGYEHQYVLQSNRPFARAPKVIARLATAITGLVFDRRPAKAFTLEKRDSLEPRNHPIVLMTMTAL